MIHPFNDGLTGLRSGDITLHLVTPENRESIRAILSDAPDSDDIIAKLDGHYRPQCDDEGRPTRWGFLVTWNDQPAGMTLLGVSSWPALCGYTGADTLAHLRGRGIAPRSKPHLFHFGFHLLGLNRIEAGCARSNTASRRSIEKTPGFEFEGVLRQYAPGIQDELRYAIMRDDWLRLYDPAAVELVPSLSRTPPRQGSATPSLSVP